MNISKRSTLRRWIKDGWEWVRVEAYKSTNVSGIKHLRRAQRWARFAVACEMELKRMDAEPRNSRVWTVSIPESDLARYAEMQRKALLRNDLPSQYERGR